MEHAKKMVLVEPRQIEKWKETMLEKTLSKLDGEIYGILHRDVADDEKAKLYSNSLSRYLNIDKPNVVTKFESIHGVDAAKSGTAAAAAATPAAAAAKVVDAAGVDGWKITESQVLDTVPKKWKSQASRLLTHMKNNNPEISWSSKGELVLNETTIPNTRAVDLVNDLVRKRATSSTPTGWRRLADALKVSNIPRELVGNKDRWGYINASSEETSPVTPSRRREKHRNLPSWLPY